MSRQTRFIIWILIIGLALSVFGYFYFQDDAVFKRRLDHAVSVNHELDLQSLTPFTWDRVYIFQAYTANEVIQKRTGLDWNGSSPTNDGDQLLIFVEDSAIVTSLILSSSSNGFDFLNNSDFKSFSTSEAIFTIRK